MKSTAIYILLFLFLPFSICATNHALVIGIGDYPENSGWNKIHGDNDIKYVCQYLIENGFRSNQISILKNEQATFANIKQAFENLINKASANDNVYIHFSGHGQLITDIHGDEESGFDEAWIPYDAPKYIKAFPLDEEYHGENHLVDDILYGWLNQLRAKVKQGKITVVVDACHSGGSTRDSEEKIARGTSDIFILPYNYKNHYKEQMHQEDWICISACQSFQINFENEEHQCGSLTYALYKHRSELSKISSIKLMSILENEMTSLLPQEPVLDGKAQYKQQPIF